MANLIQIKRSLNTAAPGSLANGEMAFTANGDVLAIGSNGGIVYIGGKRVPGTLTANQALVANSTSGIDQIKVGNLAFTGTTQTISANGGVGSAGYVLASGATGNVYWLNPATITTSPAGSNTQVEFNDSGAFGASAGFTFDKSANNLSVANSVLTTTVNATSFNTSGTTSNTLGVYPASNTTGTALGSTTQRWIINANTINTSGAATIGTTLSAGNTSVTGFVNATVSVNSALITAANAYVTDLYVTGNTSLGDSTSDRIAINGYISTNAIPSANVTNDLGTSLLRWKNVYSSAVIAGTGSFSGSVTVSGDLVVSGNVTTTNVNSVVISDPLIYLAGNNYTSDLVDIGFAGNYSPDGVQELHTGLFRDASDGVYKLFKGLTQELSGSATVNTADPTFAIATLNAYLQSGGLTSNGTNVTIAANSTLAVGITANTLSLSTALPTTSGGTGLNTFTSGDILVGNSSNLLSKLSVGTDGYVLQVSSGTVTWNTLDGGTF